MFPDWPADKTTLPSTFENVYAMFIVGTLVLKPADIPDFKLYPMGCSSPVHLTADDFEEFRFKDS